MFSHQYAQPRMSGNAAAGGYVQNPNYGRTPGGPGPVGGLAGNPGATDSQPGYRSPTPPMYGGPAQVVGGYDSQPGGASVMPVSNPWQAGRYDSQPGGASVMPVGTPRSIGSGGYGSVGPVGMPRQFQGYQGSVMPLAPPQGYSGGSRPDIAYPGIDYSNPGVIGRPIAPPPPRPPVGPPAMPRSIGQGPEDDYRLNPSELANLSPQERAAANRYAHNQRARDNRHDVNMRNVRLNAAANARTFANRHPVPPPPMVGGPHPFYPPGTNIHPPQRPWQMVGGPAQLAGGGNFTQALMNALGASR